MWIYGLKYFFFEFFFFQDIFSLLVLFFAIFIMFFYNCLGVFKIKLYHYNRIHSVSLTVFCRVLLYLLILKLSTYELIVNRWLLFTTKRINYMCRYVIFFKSTECSSMIAINSFVHWMQYWKKLITFFGFSNDIKILKNIKVIGWKTALKIYNCRNS